MPLTHGTFDGREPHLVHEPSGARVWFIEPVGMLTQIGDVRHAGADVAKFFSVQACNALFARRRASGHKNRLLFMHDWTQLAGYTSEARKIMTDWGLEMKPHADRIVIALAPMAKVVRMGVSVASVTLQLAGFSLETVDELQPVIQRLGVRPQDD